MKTEYITLNKMFDIIKDEVKGKCRKGTKFPQKEDGGLKEKYSLALKMWQHWYEEYTKELKKNKELEEQLNEANELLKAYGTESLWESLSLSYDEANEYCKKWGVK